MPNRIAALVDQLGAMGGVVAVALGGSHALGVADRDSDYDLAVYYRGALDTGALERHGAVHPPGSWGRIMNGGAWLAFEGAKVDILLRDLDAVEFWSERAEHGEFEIDALLGYLAGITTYSLRAELALGQTLLGALPRAPTFPEALAAAAPPRWRSHARFSLDHARMRAARNDVVGAVGQAAKAAIEVAHAVLCERHEWVLNEKRIVERSGLEHLHPVFSRVPLGPDGLAAWIARVEQVLSNA